MNFSQIVDKLLVLGNPIIALLFSLAVFVFIWGVVKYMYKTGDPTARKESIQMMTYGIIGLFVMVSVWGLVALVTDLIGQDISIPQIR